MKRNLFAKLHFVDFEFLSGETVFAFTSNWFLLCTNHSRGICINFFEWASVNQFRLRNLYYAKPLVDFWCIFSALCRIKVEQISACILALWLTLFYSVPSVCLVSRTPKVHKRLPFLSSPEKGTIEMNGIRSFDKKTIEMSSSSEEFLAIVTDKLFWLYPTILLMFWFEAFFHSHQSVCEQIFLKTDRE